MDQAQRDNELMERYYGCDDNAFYELTFLYYERLERYFVSKRLERHLVGELRDRTFTKIEESKRKKSRYRKGSMFSTWCFGIARNVTLHHFREMRRQVPLDMDHRVSLVDEMPLDWTPVGYAYHTLNGIEKDIIWFYDILEMSFEEISIIVGMRANTCVKRRLRALAKMRELLSPTLFETGDLRRA